jgi:hypothetical protein
MPENLSASGRHNPVGAAEKQCGQRLSLLSAVEVGHAVDPQTRCLNDEIEPGQGFERLRSGLLSKIGFAATIPSGFTLPSQALATMFNGCSRVGPQNSREVRMPPDLHCVQVAIRHGPPIPCVSNRSLFGQWQPFTSEQDLCRGGGNRTQMQRASRPEPPRKQKSFCFFFFRKRRIFITL